MIINRQIFETLVPAFRDAPEQDQTFRAMQPFIQAEIDRLRHLSGLTEIPFDLQADAAAFVCREAAYKAVPQLDLVLTPSGFAVVQNQNLAPASQVRVSALREDLRRTSDTAFDFLFLRLALTVEGWAELRVPRAMRRSLFWLPTIARRHGITTRSGATVFREELAELYTEISRAEQHARTIISPELHDRLLLLQDTEEVPTAYSTIIDATRDFIAVDIENNRDAALSPRRLAAQEELLRSVEGLADMLPEYKQSATYRAHHFQPYENSPEDRCFFFS